MLGRERDRREKNLQLLTMTRPKGTNTKRKTKINNEALIKEEIMTGIEWITKEENIQQYFLWVLRPEGAHQITQTKYRTDPDIIKID